MKGVSDEENVREAYRPLTKREREILELLLTVDVEGIEELRDQVSHVRGARWNCGCASFNLIVDKSKAPLSTITKSPSPKLLRENLMTLTVTTSCCSGSPRAG
jgi:hypothetical protein